MDDCGIRTKTLASDEEVVRRQRFLQHFKRCPILDGELLRNLGLFVKRQDLARILFMNELYQQIVNVHGIVAEFGVRWGQNLALFESFRGIYEPCNHNRKIVGFDTFAGFPSVHEKDGDADIAAVGAYSVTEGYEDYLAEVLEFHEQESPVAYKRKYELVKGDASVEVERYLEEHPETIVALAYFDFDLYEPTRRGMQAIADRLTKGSVIGFDELNLADFPGETLALKEVFGLDRYRIRRTPYSGVSSYVVIE